MRTKTFELDGESYTFAALTYDQAKQFIRPLENSDDPVVKQFQVICMALNRVTPGQWSVEKVQSEMDLVIIRELFSAILEFSGLKAIEVHQPGEAQAVLTSS